VEGKWKIRSSCCDEEESSEVSEVEGAFIPNKESELLLLKICKATARHETSGGQMANCTDSLS
jgi:hypothetical protein